MEWQSKQNNNFINKKILFTDLLQELVLVLMDYF